MFPRRMMRRGIRRTVRRGFRVLTRGAIMTMAGAATGVTLAAIASRENISKEEAEELMDGLVAEGTLKKETRNGETVYVSTTSGSSGQVQSAPAADLKQATGSTKFCRQCGTKISIDSKFCEKCGAQL